MTRRIAVVLFNLGGPDGPDAVRPFLKNLFNDPAIIDMPGLIRGPFAEMVARKREKLAKANYDLIGGRSPLLPETVKQAEALAAAVAPRLADDEVRVFVAMRYWRPFVEDAARDVAAFAPDEVVLIPLYPQYSTTTSASSFAAWRRAYDGPGHIRTVCCYPLADGLVKAHAEAIQTAYDAAGRPEFPRLLFSAHGLPEKIVRMGDPYQAQVEATARAVAERLDGLTDWKVCYQSRVGPLRWLQPSTDAEIQTAGELGLPIVVSPIAFVSEHVETLVELDHDYAKLARDAGCSDYIRVPALGVAEKFIDALARLVTGALCQPADVIPGSRWLCGAEFGKCPRREAAA